MLVLTYISPCYNYHKKGIPFLWCVLYSESIADYTCTACPIHSLVDILCYKLIAC